MIVQCPHANSVWLRYLDKFKRVARLLDLPPFARLSPYEQLQFALGNPHPQLLEKHYDLWLELAVPVCVEFARALRLHITPLLAPDRAAPRGPARVEGSAAAGQPARHAHPPAAPPDHDPGASSDSSSSSMVGTDDDDYSSADEDPEATDPPRQSVALPLPAGFSIADSGFLSDQHFEICPINPAADALVNRYILYRWAGAGWCVGRIIARHTREVKRHKTPKGYANFVVYYECDDTTAQHTLDEESADSQVSSWVLLDKT